MSDFNYHDKQFATVANTAGGQVDARTTFHYRQDGNIVWGTYGGGDVVFGTLLARVMPDGSLDMRYQHVDAEGWMRTGACRSTPELLEDGRLRLHEEWRWTGGPGAEGEHSAGTSGIEELTAV